MASEYRGKVGGAVGRRTFMNGKTASYKTVMLNEVSVMAIEGWGSVTITRRSPCCACGGARRVPRVRVALVVVGWSESNKQPFREAQSELNFLPVVTRLPAKSQRHQVDRTCTGTATETHAATTAST